MASPARDRSSHRPAGITAEAVARAALDVVAASGTAGVTMTRVADRLGVRAPSLYHHVRDKQALLRLVATRALAAFDDDRARYDEVRVLDEWIELTADGGRRLRAYYLARPGLAAVVQATADSGRDRHSDGRGALAHAQVQALIRVGVPEPLARQAFETSAHWTLSAVAADSSGAPGGGDAAFDRGLRWLLHGLRRDLQEELAGR